MKAAGLMVLAVIILVDLSVNAASASDDDFDPNEFVRLKKYAHDTGTSWFSYGDGVITDCKSMQLYDDDEQHQYRLTLQDRNFTAARDWINRHFSRKLNLCPIRPKFEAKKCRRCVTLYPTLDLPTSTMLDDLSADAIKQSTKAFNSYLIKIPLTAETLGVDDDEANKLYLEFSKFFKRNGNNANP